MDEAIRRTRRHLVDIALSLYVVGVSLFLLSTGGALAADGSAWAHSWTMDIDLSAVDGSFQGEHVQDQLGGDNVAIIPDVNGDGIADILMAAALNDDNGSNAGKVYLMFGKTSGWSMDVVLATSTIDASFVGEAAGDTLYIEGSLGRGSKRFGDLNGDGIGDFVLTGRQNDEAGTNTGQVYVIFGQTSGWSDTVNVATAASASYQGDNASTFMGTQVSALGDVNGDNLNDFIFCSSLDDDAGANNGQCNLIFGKTSGWAMDQNIGTNGVVSASINGTDAGEQFGYVSGIGDVNADGYDDFAVGAVKDDNAGTDRGQVYVFFGKSSGWSTSSSAYTLADASYVGEADSDQLGLVVAGLGDVNGDGIDDFGFSNSNSTGEIYVVFGKRTGWAKDVSAGSADASFYSEESGDAFGGSMDGGDLNNDGYSDIVMGAHFNDEGASTMGQVFVVFGRSSGWNAGVSISTMASSSFWGEELGDFAGRDVSVGDLNNDNAGDILIGALSNDENAGGGQSTGQVYLVLAQTPPSISIQSVAYAENDSADIYVTSTVSDTNSNAQAMRFHYRLGTNCVSSTSAATLDSTVATTYTDTGGAPTVTAAAFQVGSAANKKIITSSGANTVGVTWVTRSNLSAADARYCIALAVTDGAAYSEVASTTITIDHVNPTNPGSLTVATTTATTVGFILGSASTETNFREYKILYATTTPITTSTYSLAFTSSTDSNLGSRTYASATSSTVNSLTPNTTYYFNIVAYDHYWHTAKGTEVTTSTHAAVPSSLALTSDSQKRITATWNVNGNPSGTEFYAENITKGTNSGWTTSTTWLSEDLQCDIQYFFRVRARASNNRETANSETVGIYPSACQGGGGGGGGGGGSAPTSAAAPASAASSTEPVLSSAFTIDTPEDKSALSELPFDVTGKAAAGTRVTLEIAGSKYSVETDATGRYRMTVLDDLAPGEYTLTASEPADKGGRKVSRTITYAPKGASGKKDAVPADITETAPKAAPSAAKKQPVKAQPARAPAASTAPIAAPTVPTAPVTSEAVAEAVSSAEKRKAFLLVLKKTTAQFRETQVGPVEVVPEETITIVTRPGEAVRSITARLYPKASLGSVQAYDEWIAGYLVEPTGDGDVYRGDMTIPSFARGAYILRVTMNGDLGTRSTIEKEIHVLAKGAVVKEGGNTLSVDMRIPRAHVTVYAQSGDGQFREWNASAFGAENPVWTDASGAYVFSLPAGVYYVTAVADGFEPYESGITVLKAPGIYRDVIQLMPKKSSGFFQTIFGKLLQ